PGDLLTLLSGFFFAAHMVAVAKFSRGRDIFLLTILQFLYAGILSLLCGLLWNRFPVHLEMPTVWGIVYLSVCATAAALLFQNIGQKYTEPAAASVLLSLESVFGVLCSMLFYGERPTLRMLCGFALIFCAVICSETKFSFLKRPVNALCHPGKHLCSKE
ncbi:MAG: DMT family transporter, partial [Oscillospiraceae bacterium]|nr:DMT family transporter [Oscillospiraceae bacterium]